MPEIYTLKDQYSMDQDTLKDMNQDTLKVQ
jgi:hypothetical protein